MTPVHNAKIKREAEEAKKWLSKRNKPQDKHFHSKARFSRKAEWVPKTEKIENRRTT